MKDNIINKYSYNVEWSAEDEQFVGTVQEFPSLSWLADTPEAALAGIHQIVTEAVLILRKQGRKVPLPLSKRRQHKAITGKIASAQRQHTIDVPMKMRYL